MSFHLKNGIFKIFSSQIFPCITLAFWKDQWEKHISQMVWKKKKGTLFISNQMQQLGTVSAYLFSSF